MPIGIAWHTVVLFFGLVAFTPTRLGDLHAHPMPVADYTAAVARIASAQAGEDSLVAPALEVTHVPSLLHGAVLRLALRVPNLSRASPRDSTEPDRMPGWATHAVAQTLKLGVAVRRSAAERAPAVKEMSLLLNAHDRTIANGAAIELARTWREHGAMTSIYQLPDSLQLPHDVIDPRHLGSNVGVVYPVLGAMIAGARPTGVVELR